MSNFNDVDLSNVVWRTSSRTSGGKDCVEVAFLPDGSIGVRDSKDRTGPALRFTPTEWDTFTATLTDPNLSH
ncbi:DUF397 domain-containing protein [Nocardia mexicana]|uniref:Uncharacterized protein DUF397 n=1 Tax=Nocardia mexicana TaxID=279262 RepID=A0A370GVE0_9NOCA|nr:DUF397 domain-containing protein [Nocardia mexicana]RDI47226.1 uncharacterized protein DUF397 [Nocardia mexicana]